MLLGAGFAISFDAARLRIPLAAGAGIAVLAAIWIVAQRRYVELALASARSDVLPVLEQSLAGTPPATKPTDVERLDKLQRVALLESVAEPASAARAARPSRPALVEAVAAPVANRATSSLRSGACPLCKNTEIRTLERTPGFRTYVCSGCGYTQEFAEL